MYRADTIGLMISSKGMMLMDEIDIDEFMTEIETFGSY